MNTGIATATTLNVQIYNSSDVIILSKEYDLLDAFGEIPAISIKEFLQMDIEEIKNRSDKLIQYVTHLLNIGVDRIKIENEVVKTDYDQCPIDIGKEIREIEVETSLKRDSLNDLSYFETSFDAVEHEDQSPYLIEFFMIGFDLFQFGTDAINKNNRPFIEDAYFQEIDYHKGNKGELLYKASGSRSDIVFDINDKGELIVIGPDADAYSINDKGELIYDLYHTNRIHN